MDNGLLQALGAVGDVLDTPASILRGLVSGQPGRALGGIMDPSQRVHGSEWTGDPLTGMAVDIGLDPLNLIGGLGLLKGLKAARAAKASNATREALLASGGMPEEIANLTKIVDKSGQPMKTFHGTGSVYDTFDMNKMAPNSLYGKGIYTTADPEMASTYAKNAGTHTHEAIASEQQIADAMRKHYDEATTGIARPGPADMSNGEWMQEAKYWLNDNPSSMTPEIQGMFKSSVTPQNVRMHYVDARRPLNLDKIPAEKLYKKLKKTEGRYSDLPHPGANDEIGDLALDTVDVPKTAGDYLQELIRTRGDESTRELLKAAGFDALRHKGGVVTGGKAHKVVIALSPEQMYSPWVAPAARQVPSQSPLAAALVGHNAIARKRGLGENYD